MNKTYSLREYEQLIEENSNINTKSILEAALLARQMQERGSHINGNSFTNNNSLPPVPLPRPSSQKFYEKEFQDGSPSGEKPPPPPPVPESRKEEEKPHSSTLPPLTQNEYGSKTNPLIFKEQIFAHCDFEIAENAFAIFRKCVFIDVQLKGQYTMEDCTFKKDDYVIETSIEKPSNYTFFIRANSTHKSVVSGLIIPGPPLSPVRGTTAASTSSTSPFVPGFIRRKLSFWSKSP